MVLSTPTPILDLLSNSSDFATSELGSGGGPRLVLRIHEESSVMESRQSWVPQVHGGQQTKRLQECWLWMRRAGKVSVTTGPGEPRDQDVRRWGVRGRDRAVLRQLPRPKADRSTSSELPHWLPMTAKSTGRYSASRRAACAVWPPCRKCCPERGGAASASITPEAQSA